MKKIEDQFQALIDRLEAGYLLPLSPEDHRRTTRFWALWQWRNHFVDHPLEEVILFAAVTGDSAMSKALPSAVPGSAMRLYICLRPASQYGGIDSRSVIRFAGAAYATAAAYRSGVKATPASVA